MEPPNETVDVQTGEVLPAVYQPAPLRHIVDAIGEDEVQERVADALSRTGAVANISGNDYVTAVGSQLVAQALGVSISTEVESRIAADGEVEYVATATVLGPFGQIVRAQSLYALSDAKKRPGKPLDRGQVAHLCQTRAMNRVMKQAYSAFWSEGVVNTQDDGPQTVEGTVLDRSTPAPARNAPRRPQEREGAPKPANPKPATTSATSDDPPPDPRIIAANAQRAALVKQHGEESEQVGKYDVSMAERRHFNWSPQLETFVVWQEEA